MKFYAVPSGRVPGVYSDFEKANAQILDFPGGIMASFSGVEEAYEFMTRNAKPTATPKRPEWKPSAPAAPKKVLFKDMDDDIHEDIEDDSPAPPPAKKAKVGARPDESGTCSLYFDGGCKGNGTAAADAGAGFILRDARGEQLLEKQIYLGKATNNQAEYAGLEEGLRAAATLNIRELRVYGDSELVIKQMLGAYKVKNEALKLVHARARSLIDHHFDKVTFFHVYREYNKEADALANKAIAEKKTL